jgi:hypothetical protein
VATFSIDTDGRNTANLGACRPRGGPGWTKDVRMTLNTDLIDAAMLALLLGLHDGDRAWKSFDWDAMDRLHARGLISNLAGKAKSVVFTAEGREKGLALLQLQFGEPG